MDDDMVEFVEKYFEAEEIDVDYEFDAPRFYDFTRLETILEIREAEHWFKSAQSYPPSPFIVEWIKSNNVPPEIASTSSKCKVGDMMYVSGDSMDFEFSSLYDSNGDSQLCQEIPKAKTKSQVKVSPLRSSNLMKPTESQLAKLNQPQEIHCKRLMRRFQKIVKFEKKTSQYSSAIGIHATKRQKLEVGYLRKDAHLKHQALFLHKATEKVGFRDINSALGRPKVTVPRAPNLETANRAQRRRFKIKTESDEHSKSNTCTFKARPLNRKIFEAPSLPLPRKSTPQLPEFKVFQLKTAERAVQHATVVPGNIPNCTCISQNGNIDARIVNSANALKEEKLEAAQRCQTRRLDKKIFSSEGEIDVFQNIIHETAVSMEFKFPTNGRFPNELPIELFNKLSLASEAQSDGKSQSNISLHTVVAKENAPDSFQTDREMMAMVKEKSQKSSGKQRWCGSSQSIHKGGSGININR